MDSEANTRRLAVYESVELSYKVEKGSKKYCMKY